MKRTTVVVVGGGQAGLAMSACLSARGIDHVVIERGRVAERWRSERWDSLRLLTPNWQSRLPGARYVGPDPDGFMGAKQVIELLEGYAQSIHAPVEEHTAVRRVRVGGRGYRVETDRGSFDAQNVVIATGHAARPIVPSFARALPSRLLQLPASRYHNPSQLPDGGVLVVGASASGVQLADELARSGRRVVLAVGRHTRMPRRYRGRDVMFWLDRMGVLDESADSVPDLDAARQQPSMQLVGRDDHPSLDLPVLQAAGVQIVGRALGVEGERLALSCDLLATTTAADAKLRRLLARIDRFLARAGVSAAFPEEAWPARFEPPRGPSALHLADEGIRSVLFATGFVPSNPWLEVPVRDQRGQIRHWGGITPSPGLYVMGLRFMRRRKSSFIDGVADDARDLAEHIASRLDQRSAA